MKYLKLILLFCLALALLSCDRFDHGKERIDFNTELFNPLQLALNTAYSNPAAVMEFYSENYLHNATDKAGRDEFYHSLFFTYGNDARLTARFVNYSPQSQSVNWELLVLPADRDAALAVFSFTDEKIVKVDGAWRFYGNQISDLEQGERQRIIFESFTYTTCPNCPLVEQLMHSLAAQYPAQFSYLEYHIGDPLQIPSNTEIFTYYGPSPMPATILQGMEKRLGANPATLEALVSFVQSMLSNSPALFLEDLNYALEGNTLNGSIKIRTANPGFDQTDLKLRYHIIEKVSTFTNTAGDPCTNVVLASGTLDLSGANLSQTQSFSLPFGGTLPSDASLVIYAQKMPATFANNAMIYNGIEVALGSK